MYSGTSDLNQIRRRILTSAFKANEGHIPTSFSILEILYYFYDFQIKKYGSVESSPDRLILSKGHAAIGLYSVLAHFKLIPNDWLDTFCTFDSPLGGHPDQRKIPHVHASTGSLGHGLPIAVGMALGEIILKRSSKIYVLVGDGELNEGSNWESILVAAHHGLHGLSLIVDVNDSSARALKMENLKGKFQSFGWTVSEIDGHSQKDIETYFTHDNTRTTKSPNVLLAKTIKGKGVRRMENSHEWHHKVPSRHELEEMLLELK